ncbi:dienelactone hydrolase family protein [Nocardia wallacei]|uniref:dienelactone hydrolase family protein n=1 Tax=Nocardia wallacei TaxID=480035 RepID=UPI002456BE81|nr:dienelactone hydrolase family protein [Nocardia wallacei]
MTAGEEVRIRLGEVRLDAHVTRPARGGGIVVFAHGSGSGRHSPRNRHVASILHQAGFGTVLLDLLTPDEERYDLRTRELRFDIALLAGRVAGTVDWLADQPGTRQSPVGLFGASTGAAAALVTAAERPAAVHAVVSRGGRADLAGDALTRVRAPTLLIVGEHDREVLELNRQAMRRMAVAPRLEIVRGAGHLFEEPGTLDEAARLSSEWFHRTVAGSPTTPPSS